MSASNVGDLGLIPGSGRSSGEGNGNPLQYSCLENPMGGGAWWATVHGVPKSRTRLSDLTNYRALKSMSWFKETLECFQTMLLYFIQTTMYKINKLQVYIVQHREYS